MEVTYTYFLEHQIFETTFKNPSVDFPPRPITVICPECGESWCRIVPTGEGVSSRWLVQEKPCKFHNHYEQVPGSLLYYKYGIEKRHSISPYFWSMTLEYLPLQLLNREVLLTINFKQEVYK